MYHVHTGTYLGFLNVYTAAESSSFDGILCEQSKNL